MTINNAVGIIANYWQLLGGLITLLVFLQAKYQIFSMAWDKVTRPDKSIEKFSSTFKEGLQDLESINLIEAKVFSIRTGMPNLQPVETKDLPKEELPFLQDGDIVKLAKAIKPNINKTHAFVVGNEFRQLGKRLIRFVRSDYAMVRAARKKGTKPPIISANAIIFCPHTKRVLVHVRAPTVATYASALHFIGGNYEPALDSELFDDVDPVSPLRKTAIREIQEETGIEVSDPDNNLVKNALVLVSEETSTGFVQFTYIGISVKSEKEANRPSPEGALEWFSLSDLCNFSETGKLPGMESDSIKIVPSFALCLLIWLKLGAPDQCRRTPLRKDAHRAYQTILHNINQRLASYSP